MCLFFSLFFAVYSDHSYSRPITFLKSKTWYWSTQGSVVVIFRAILISFCPCYLHTYSFLMDCCDGNCLFLWLSVTKVQILKSKILIYLSPQDGLQLHIQLTAMAAYQWRAAGCGGANGCALTDCAAVAGLTPLPGFSQHHHLGVHVSTPHLLPQTLWHRWKPLWPWHLEQPLGFLLCLGHSDMGAGLLQGRQRPGLVS